MVFEHLFGDLNGNGKWLSIFIAKHIDPDAVLFFNFVVVSLRYGKLSPFIVKLINHLLVTRLEKSFKKFYGRYQDLIKKYRRSVNAMVSDSFPGQFLFNM